MAESLAIPDDLADLLMRPLADAETLVVTRLLAKASALLRQAMPGIDDRIALYPGPDPRALDPTLVANVVATIVKRLSDNPQGAASKSETVGPYSASFTFAAQGETATRGELQVTQSDLDALRPAGRTSQRVGSIRLRPGLAPWPWGQLGSVVATEIVEF